MTARILYIFIFLLFSQLSYAQSSCEPELDNLPVPAYFSDLYADAVSVGSYINSEPVNNTASAEVNNKFLNFARNVRKQALRTLAHLPLNPQLQSQMDAFVSMAERGLDKNNLPSFSLTLDPFTANLYIYSFTNNTDGQEGSFISTQTECNPTNSKLPGCVAGLMALQQAIEPYKAAFTHCSAKDTADNVARLTANWQRYLDEARSQTFTDMLLTSYLEKDHLTKNYLTGAMKRQWFFLHPDIVIENVHKAIDGSNTQEGIVIEWLGVNWWDKKSSPLGFPFGVSLSSLYSDRQNIDDIGHGIMFHFDNRYSLGWASHGGDNGIYISIDLLDSIQNKKSQWNKYKTQINEYSMEFKQ